MKGQKGNEAGNTADGGLMLNGMTAEGLFDELKKFYWVEHEGPNRHDPNSERQRRISTHQDGLESIVKGALGQSIKAKKTQAENIVRQLAYALAQTENLDIALEAFDDEKVRKYLSEAASATQNPTIGNKINFIESIANMIAAKPGDPQYDRNSPLAVLIGYIASQKDTESRRINYDSQLLAEYWQKPGIGIELQKLASEIFNIPLDKTATASDALSEIRTRAAVESQKYAATDPDKTYLRTKDYGQGKHPVAKAPEQKAA